MRAAAPISKEFAGEVVFVSASRSEAARAARERFSLERMVEETERVYAEALKHFGA